MGKIKLSQLREQQLSSSTLATEKSSADLKQELAAEQEASQPRSRQARKRMLALLALLSFGCTFVGHVYRGSGGRGSGSGGSIFTDLPSPAQVFYRAHVLPTTRGRPPPPPPPINPWPRSRRRGSARHRRIRLLMGSFRHVQSPGSSSGRESPGLMRLSALRWHQMRPLRPLQRRTKRCHRECWCRRSRVLQQLAWAVKALLRRRSSC
jgi:hypothetical protein